MFVLHERALPLTYNVDNNLLESASKNFCGYRTYTLETNLWVWTLGFFASSFFWIKTRKVELIPFANCARLEDLLKTFIRFAFTMSK